MPETLPECRRECNGGQTPPHPASTETMGTEMTRGPGEPANGWRGRRPSRVHEAGTDVGTEMHRRPRSRPTLVTIVSYI